MELLIKSIVTNNQALNISNIVFSSMLFLGMIVLSSLDLKYHKMKFKYILLVSVIPFLQVISGAIILGKTNLLIFTPIALIMYVVMIGLNITLNKQKLIGKADVDFFALMVAMCSFVVAGIGEDYFNLKATMFISEALLYLAISLFAFLVFSIITIIINYFVNKRVGEKPSLMESVKNAKLPLLMGLILPIFALPLMVLQI